MQVLDHLILPISLLLLLALPCQAIESPSVKVECVLRSVETYSFEFADAPSNPAERGHIRDFMAHMIEFI